MAVSSNFDRRRGSGSVAVSLSAAAVAVIALFCSSLAFQTASVETFRAEDLDRHRDELALVEARHAVRRLALEGLTQRLLDESGAQTVWLRGDDAAQTSEALRAVASSGGAVGADGALIVDTVAAVGGLDGLAEANVAELLEVADAAHRLGRSSSGVAVIDELRAASDGVLAPSVLLNGVLAAALHSEVRSGLDDLDPTIASHLPQLIDQAVHTSTVDELAALQDQLAAYVAGNGPVPAADAAELVTRTGATLGELSAAWASTAEAIDAEQDLAERASESRVLRFRIAGFALAAVAAVLLLAGLLAVIWGLRRERVVPPHPDVEPITGLPTRATFDRRIAPFVADRRFTEHLIGVVRITDLAMIVDGYGRGAADRVEAVVTRRLRAAVGWLTSNRSEAAAVLVRLRAGEYAVTIHAAHGIDLDLVRRVVTLQSGSPIRLGQDHLPIRYGVGLHHEHGILDLDAALDAAEHAVIDHVPAPTPTRVLLGGPLDLTRGR